MKTISINIRTDRLSTPYEIQRAICNRQELLENRAINYPPLTNKKNKMVVNWITGHSFFEHIIKKSSKYLP